MIGPLIFSTIAAASTDVALGWYQWRVGRDEDAWSTARAAAAARPDDLAAFQLLAAMEVARGAGPSFEVSVREQWGEAPSDPARRTRLATVVSLRHATPGPWCDEVKTLVTKVPPDDGAALWATLADRQRELRCSGTTDHADADLRRLLNAGSSGWADGVLAKVEAGYFKDELPDELERLWAEHPDKLDRAGPVFAEGVLGYANAGMDKKAEEALARLKETDPEAEPPDLDLTRSIDDVRDPEVYVAIAECKRQELNSAIRCFDAITAPPGPPTATLQFERRAALEGLRRFDEAHAAARAAWQADPTNRAYARFFVRSAVARQEDAELAVEALAIAMPVVPATMDEVPKDRRVAVASDLELRTQTLRLAGRTAEAIDGQRLALALDPTPERRLLLGLVLADAGAPDEAILQLAHGLVKAQVDTARISAARDALGTLAKSRGSSMPVLVAEAGREPGAMPDHALKGKLFAAPEGWLPAAAEGAEPAPVVLVTWGTIDPGWEAVLDRLEGLARLYQKNGVRFGAIGLDASPLTLPADLGVHVAQPGPTAAATVRSVAIPTALVLDAKGAVTTVLVPWDPKAMALEKALDQLTADH
jgi:tetratricopeptide (TPR) repeat protein